MALLDKMTLDQLMEVRKIRSSHDADDFLKKFNLSGGELAQARKLLQVKDKFHDNRLWMATAWLLGASFPMIAREKGVAKQSVMQAIDKLLPVETRRQGRLGAINSLEVMSEYKVKFFENITTLTDMTPQEAAQWLLANTSLDRIE